jgi:hypothetical protein
LIGCGWPADERSAETINQFDASFRAQLMDNLENGAENRIINGILQLKFAKETKP